MYNSFFLVILTLARLSRPALSNFYNKNEKLSISTRVEECSDDTSKLFDLSKFRITGDINSFTVSGEIRLLQEIKEPAKFSFTSTTAVMDKDNSMSFHPFVLHKFCEEDHFYIIGFLENVVPRIFSCPIPPGVYTIKDTTIDLSLHVGNKLVRHWRTHFLMDAANVTACVDIVYECQTDSD